MSDKETFKEWFNPFDDSMATSKVEVLAGSVELAKEMVIYG